MPRPNNLDDAIAAAVKAQVREHNTGQSADKAIAHADRIATREGIELDWRPGLYPIRRDTN